MGVGCEDSLGLGGAVRVSLVSCRALWESPLSRGGAVGVPLVSLGGATGVPLVWLGVCGGPPRLGGGLWGSPWSLRELWWSPGLDGGLRGSSWSWGGLRGSLSWG